MSRLAQVEIEAERDRKPTPLSLLSVRQWTRFFGEARTRILFWYLLLMMFFIVISAPLIRQRVFAQVDARVRDDLAEEFEDFEQLLAGELSERDEAVLERRRKEGRRVPNGAPKTTGELATLFDVFLSRRIPEDDTFLIAIIDGEFYKSSPRALPKPLQQDQALMQRWKQTTTSSRGEPEVPEPSVGSILYIAEPIQADGKTLGVLVAAHTTAGERQEVLESLIAMSEVIVSVLVLILILAWFVSGRVLAPLRVLAATAHSISESDLTQRIPVRGEGELAELAITFNEMMDRLESSFATQREFVNDAGHELRTPITIIRGHLELMGDDPQEQQETLSLVLDELDRMSRFVEDLILLAKAERPDFLQLETVNVQAFTEELLAKAQALAPRNWQLDAAGKGNVVVDRQRVTEAVMNLAQNSTQFTNQDDTIAIGSATNRSGVRFWVRDTGEGITSGDQQRIFERFARAANSRRRSEGAGLGLSIVKAIVEAHGGQIFLRSKLGTGSTFTLVLPLEPPQGTASHESDSDC